MKEKKKKKKKKKGGGVGGVRWNSNFFEDKKRRSVRYTAFVPSARQSVTLLPA